jgi:hypothetical protein
VTGYRKIRWFTHEFLGGGEVNLPPTHLNTVGYWIAINEEQSTTSKLTCYGIRVKLIMAWSGKPSASKSYAGMAAAARFVDTLDPANPCTFTISNPFAALPSD